uniref:Si:dkey-30c15.2 n=1 Tax=Maylandia zebra TaxID=106582 RepID=A0A3P9CXB5_9CICH
MTFYFISFLLVVVYAWKSKNAIQGWRERPADDDLNTCRRPEIVIPVYAIVWLIPLALYLAYVLTPFMKATLLIPATSSLPNRVSSNDSTYCTSCILFLHVWRESCSDVEIIHDVFIRAFLFIVVIPVLVSCSIIYYKVGKWYERRDLEGLFPVEGDGRSRRRMKRAISTSRNMVTVILICWAPALFLILLSTLLMRTNVEQYSLFGVYMLQAASVSLQGFLNSMVYAWRRPNFTEAVLGESTPLVAYNHMPFFEESLRTSF